MSYNIHKCLFSWRTEKPEEKKRLFLDHPDRDGVRPSILNQKLLVCCAWSTQYMPSSCHSLRKSLAGILIAYSLHGPVSQHFLHSPFWLSVWFQGRLQKVGGGLGESGCIRRSPPPKMAFASPHRDPLHVLLPHTVPWGKIHRALAFCPHSL